MKNKMNELEKKYFNLRVKLKSKRNSLKAKQKRTGTITKVPALPKIPKRITESSFNKLTVSLNKVNKELAKLKGSKKSTKRITAYTAEYIKVRKSIQQKIYRARKRGFIITSEDLLPKIPLRVNKSDVTKIKKINENFSNIILKYPVVDFLTGVIIQPSNTQYKEVIETNKRYTKIPDNIKDLTQEHELDEIEEIIDTISQKPDLSETIEYPSISNIDISSLQPLETTEYIPVFDVVERIKEMIYAFESGSESSFYYSEYSGILSKIFEDNLSYYGEKEYTDYLLTVESDLSTELNRLIRYLDEQEVVEVQSFINVATLLNYGEAVNLSLYGIDEGDFRLSKNARKKR